MAGRFPGADSVSEFWENLRLGQESVTTLSEEQLSAAGVSAKTLADPAYVRRAAMLDGIDEFDADYFGMNPYTARMMDPQQRLFLQTASHALEDSGYDPATFDGAIGVFASSTASGYLMDNLMSHRDTRTLVGEGITVEMFNLVLLNDKDYIATRTSHELNLRGPSLSVQTACSSSLVAVHLACQSLLARECDMALAGAAAIRVPHRVGYTYEPGAMVSPSGHCRPFDADSDGTIFGSGVAALILKPLRTACDEGDLRSTRRRRPGRGHRRGARRRRCRLLEHRLRGDPRHRHPAGRPHRNRGPAKGFRGLRPGTLRSVCAGLGEIQHRPPRRGVRGHRIGQGDPLSEEQGNSADGPLHLTES
jgi:phthiocerol/phenolphthiocerol synthesis type-I polyketide synthase E